MPRGQDPQPVQGGGLSPYVAQSLQQGKQQAENRLLAARQEAGATGRAQMQEQGATQRTQMQIQSQQRMQAAELEAEDRRSAEAEAARREDQRYNQMMQEGQQAFMAEQNRLQREFTTARDDKQFDREDQALDRMLDNVTLQSMIDAESSRQRNKVILAIASMSQKGETAKQRMVTALADDAEEASQAAEIHANMKSRVVEAVSADRRMNAPIGGAIETRAGQPRKIQMFGGGAGATIPTTEEYIKPQSGPDPLGVLQEQMRGNGSKLSVDDLLSGQADGVSRKLASGELKKQDVQAAASTLDGMIEALTARRDEAKGNLAQGFWRRNLNDIKRMRVNLSQLMYDSMKIEGQDNLSVGSVVRDALGPIDGLSTGSQIAKMKEFYNTSAESASEYLNELGKATEVPGLLSAPEGASDYLLELIDRRNQARMSAFPETQRR